jgi:outer membrane protein assembly factor BamB
MMYGVSVSQDGHYVFAQQDMRGLYCLDAKTGNVVWKTRSKAEISHILVLQQHLCCAKSRDEIQLIDINTGEVIKAHKTPFDNRFEVLNDNYILNHTRGKLWEILSSQTLEVVQSFSDKEFTARRRSVEEFYRSRS